MWMKLVAGRAACGRKPREQSTKRIYFRASDGVTSVHHADRSAKTWYVCWNCVHKGVAQRGAQSLIAHKPENLVLYDWSSRRDRRTVRGLRGGCWVLGRDVKGLARIGGGGIAPKGVGRAVNELVPDFMPTFTTDPGRQPYSALGFCTVLNS